MIWIKKTLISLICFYNVELKRKSQNWERARPFDQLKQLGFLPKT
jgi:hypothetical protein